MGKTIGRIRGSAESGVITTWLQTICHTCYMGGVDHCSLHCRLAKFRGLMIMGKYGAVIGVKEPIACEFTLGTYKKTRFLTNHSAVFPHDHQSTEFRQTTEQCKLQWLRPSS
jgi:hypothetical protein